ncbi:BTAD domain-containing putative transcriptional regulator [Streptomyces sp. NPDC058092]|uniref:AfsR/SARP family transcriptional regulator n=1 Tax=Streptomyces sp. NPDC058092 TaxID=3346336 RepID=UPI0036E095F0
MSVPGGYCLLAPPDPCDDLPFLDQVTAGRAALGEADTARAIKPLSTALSLWDVDRAAIGVPRYGPLDRWLNHLDEERMRAMADLADAYIQLGEPRAALRDLEYLLAIAPLRSRSWELRMRAHRRRAALGEVSDTYRASAATHRRELGITPVGQLRTLHS